MRKNFHPLSLAFLSALLIIFSFPPFKTGFFAYFAFLPLFAALEQTKKPFLLGLFWGMVYFYGLIYWVALADKALIFVSVLMVLYLSLYSVVFVLLTHKLWQKSKFPLWLVAPACWIIIEYAVSLTDMAFPWVLMGYTQQRPLQLLQFISYTGIWGLSFWVMLINTLLYTIIKNLKNKKIVIPSASIIFLLILLPVLHGNYILNQKIKPEQTVKLGILQGNIPQHIKWKDPYESYSVNSYLSLSSRLAQHDSVDLAIWPETSIPCYLEWRPKYIYQIKDMVQNTKIPALVGSEDKTIRNKRRCIYNSAYFFDNNSSLYQQYDKIKLVPFSERMPFSDKLPFLVDWDVGSSDFYRGDEQVIFKLDDTKFGAEICYEIVFPNFTRQYILRGADFIVNMTNDAWWLRSSGTYQHASIVKYRAIENRIPIARSTNTGFSFFVDPFGRELEKTQLFQRTFIVKELPIFDGLTFYTKHGDWFAHLCLIITGILLSISITKNFILKARKK